MEPADRGSLPAVVGDECLTALGLAALFLVTIAAALLVGW